MIHAPSGAPREGRVFARALAAAAPRSPALVDSESAVGGGAAPTVRCPRWPSPSTPARPDHFASELRRGSPPVVVRVAEDRILVDLRTVRPDEEETLLAALAQAARAR
jgi:L-seryl-tRNA(Ser) seleniumtransferase